MTFNTALSGLRASNSDLEVTGNNIANASTIGFKKSRAEFGDVYANSLIGTGGNQAGTGVLVNNISQQFDQGNVSFTDNSLDLAINGGGFFILSDSGTQAFTRAGYFGLDRNGFIVANNGARLQGFPADDQGGITNGVLGDLQVQTSNISPRATSEVDLEFNLNSDADVIDPATDPFDATDQNTFNSSNSLTVYDSQGNSHILTSYFAKRGSNDWEAYFYIDGANVVAPPFVAPQTEPSYSLNFDSVGDLTTTPPTLDVDNWNPANGVLTAPASNFVININNSTQVQGEFSIANVDQDGYAAGRLTGVEVDNTGIIFARYNNGEALALGQVALANFDNPQGLTPLGQTQWAESFESGLPVIGEPQSGSLGLIQSGALEESNVDLSEELVRLIIAQRNYQANAKTIETADTVTQAIINIR